MTNQLKIKILFFILCIGLASGAAAQDASAYVNKVYAYNPAPGQFINTLPIYSEGDTEAMMIEKVEAKLVGQLGTTNYVCLGGWGGYIIVGFDHTIANVQGEADFIVGGNAVSPGKKANPIPASERPSTGAFSRDSIVTGSAEPGIIYVSRDENGDGLPNDTWYEIAGSEYDRTIDYSVTYQKPENKNADIVGIDSNGDTVIIKRNNFHQQAYFPQWTGDSQYTLTGRLLPNNILPGTMTLVTLDYGYADNHQNTNADAGINIDWAVDREGRPAGLAGIDFVKIQTGVCQDGGAMGETSTEVTGVEDLHPEIQVSGLERIEEKNKIVKYLKEGQIIIQKQQIIFTILGQKIQQ